MKPVEWEEVKTRFDAKFGKTKEPTGDPHIPFPPSSLKISSPGIVPGPAPPHSSNNNATIDTQSFERESERVSDGTVVETTQNTTINY